MDKAPVFVGIDVSKRRLDVHLRPAGESFTIDYDEKRWRRWSSACSPLSRRWSCSRPPAAWRSALPAPWPRPACRWRWSTRARSAPSPVRWGRLAKTDRLDAKAIARFRRGGATSRAAPARRGDPPLGGLGGATTPAARDAGGRAQPPPGRRSSPARADRRPPPLAGGSPGRDRARPRWSGPGEPDLARQGRAAPLGAGRSGR